MFFGAVVCLHSRQFLCLCYLLLVSMAVSVRKKEAMGGHIDKEQGTQIAMLHYSNDAQRSVSWSGYLPAAWARL